MGSYFARVVLVPSAVFLSVLFGGAYGSGREVVEFISQHGPVGGFIAIATIAQVYLLCLFMVYELGRIFQTHEYRGFARQLLGPARHLYEIIIVIGLTLGLAICASAGGSIFESHFGLPAITGGIGVLLIIVTLTYFGRQIVEKSMIAAVSALGLVLIYLVYVVLDQHGNEVSTAFVSQPVVSDGISTGLKYALSNCGFLPLLLYSARDLQSRSESAVAAAFAAMVGVIPGIAFHFSFMMAYPQIVDQQLPTYWLFEQITSSTFLNVYVAVVFVLVAQTGVGLLQGVLESIDQIMIRRRGKALPPAGHALFSGAAVITASLLTTMGLVALIIRTYTFLSAAFVLVFYIPLLTRGIYMLVRHRS